jgi:hypothetical protein
MNDNAPPYNKDVLAIGKAIDWQELTDQATAAPTRNDHVIPAMASNDRLARRRIRVRRCSQGA